MLQLGSDSDFRRGYNSEDEGMKNSKKSVKVKKAKVKAEIVKPVTSKTIKTEKRTSQGDIEVSYTEKLKNAEYEKQLDKLGIELVKLQEWIKLKKLKVFMMC